MQKALGLGTVLSVALALGLVSAPAYAQGGGATSAIAGVVIDSSGGVIPGATVTATNNATSGKFNSVTGVNGTFTIPALAVGKYTVTVTLQGFKTAVLKDVDVSAGAPAEVRVTLEVGGFGETVTVETAAEVVRTTSASIATTINTKQIQSLPLGRDLLNGGLVTFLPGIMTPGSTRDSTINGLPQSSINITLDGVSIQDNYLKTTDGFFARVSPRLDAIEEVTVTMAASGADAAGMGATSIKFTTRSGSNQFSGSGYYYFQHQNLNTKTYNQDVNNLPRSVSVLHQPGVRVGGPVVMPGIYDGRGKLFFFVNYEESLSPRTGDRTTDFISPEALNGIFRYDTSTGVQERNLYALAAAAGQTSTPDPTIYALLLQMRSAIDSYSGGSIEPRPGDYRLLRKNWIDAIVAVGMHAGAGNRTGFLAHTYTSFDIEYRVNGVPFNESMILAMGAARLKIPVIMVSGDDQLEREIRKAMPWAKYGVVKHAVNVGKAEPLARDAASRNIETAAREGVQALAQAKVFEMPGPYRFALKFEDAAQAQNAALLPGAEILTDGQTVQIRANDFEEGYRLSLRLISLAGVVRGAAGSNVAIGKLPNAQDIRTGITDWSYDRWINGVPVTQPATPASRYWGAR